MDVIARCAFGMKIDSLGNKDDPFAKNAKVVFSPPLSRTPLVILPCKYYFLINKLDSKTILLSMHHISPYSGRRTTPRETAVRDQRVPVFYEHFGEPSQRTSTKQRSKMFENI